MGRGKICYCHVSVGFYLVFGCWLKGGTAYLSNNNPRARTPGTGKEEDVDADERDHSADGLGILSIGDTNNGDDELADNHSESTPQQQRATTNFLNGPESNRSREHVDDGGDHADEERVVDGSEGLEEGCAEVEDEVDTGPPGVMLDG